MAPRHNGQMFKQPMMPFSHLAVYFRWLVLVLGLFTGMETALLRADQIVYDDALTNGWSSYGWATLNYSNPTPVHAGADSISVSSSGYQALYLHHAAQSGALFTSLVFWINGGAGGQNISVQVTSNGVALTNFISLAPLPTNAWRQQTISLASLGASSLTAFDGFWLKVQTGGTAPTFYVDDISLTTKAIVAGTNAPISIFINANSNRLAISPLIYGVAFADSSNQLQDLNVPLHRSGGNGTTTYNWQINAWNHAADWYFESIAEDSSAAGGDGDDFILESKGGGAQPMLTIPILGWVAKLGANRASLASYSISKYGAQTSVDPYWANAGNGISSPSGLNIATNDPTDANMIADTNFQSGWVRHLTNQWGTAGAGGLRYYIMDNEWSIWQGTHRDVHPVGATMDEVLGKFSDYSAMVKSIDPNSLVAGPEEWGWPGYLYSGYDQQWSGANTNYNPANYPDRTAHGGQDFGPWFLSQLQARSQAAGRRLIDVFTLHCYPQEGSVGTDAADSATALLRNQSTRQFWDTNYVDPSWINSVIALIPRMRSWVTTNYPGTKIGITEYNWGAEPDINGATAQADILGIFGREGLDLATRWTTPDPSTPTYKAMKMYRNYDGNKSVFGDTSIATAVPDPDILSAFGAVRTSDGAMTLMVINKDILNASPFTMGITNFNATGTAQRWQLTAANVITQLANVSFTNNLLNDLVPAQSITLYVLPPVNPFSLQVGTNAAPGNLTVWLYGQTNLTYLLQASTNLVHWTALATNTLTSNSFPFSVSATNSSVKFYRGLWSP
jgi:hypothetical protein